MFSISILQLVESGVLQQEKSAVITDYIGFEAFLVSSFPSRNMLMDSFFMILIYLTLISWKVSR